MSLLDRVRDCAVFDPGAYRPFVVAGVEIGLVAAPTVKRLSAHGDVFRVTDDAVVLDPDLRTYAARSDAVAGVLAGWRADGHIPGWREEVYPVAAGIASPAFFEMERAAVPLFGVMGYGVHLNGYVSVGGKISMWVGRRSMTKPTGPGKFDQLVAGGQPVGLSLVENLIKECAEEAGIPADLAANARPVGTVTYCTEREEGLRRDVLFNFDLELPPDFVPWNTDGEVDEFFQMPLDRLEEVIAETRDFKFNAALVNIDFLVRHGWIEADDADYADIVAGLHC